MRSVEIETRKNLLSYIEDSTLSPTPHIHKDIELVYVEKGRVKCYADDSFYYAENGDMFVAFPNQIHYYTDAEIGKYHVWILGVSIIYNLKELFFNNIPVNNIMHIDENSPAWRLIDEFIKENGEYYQTVRAGILNRLLPMFLSQTELKYKPETTSSTLKKILDYCNQNYSSAITLEQVAEALHFSKYHISRLLNEHLNIGFNQYINTIRISEAIYLMQDKSKTLTYISQEVGFGSIRTFNRAFMDIMHTTPSLYLKQL